MYEAVMVTTNWSIVFQMGTNSRISSKNSQFHEPSWFRSQEQVSQTSQRTLSHRVQCLSSVIVQMMMLICVAVYVVCVCVWCALL